jgi:hypothetical protein
MSKLIKWTVILISFFIVLWALWNLERWAGEWKDLFFYLDDWTMYVLVALIVIVLGALIKKLFITEVKVLK